MSLVDEDLLDYYQRELTYLRKMGAAFAQSFPKVAARLEIGPDQSPDPNVERLIESFAFLTGRIQRNLENEFPEVTTSLLGLLYPQLVDPIPAMSIARFDVDPAQGKLTDGFLIKRGTPLFAQTEDRDVRCRFRTSYDVTLWPIEVEEARIESPDRFNFLDAADAAAVLRLRLRAVGESFHKLSVRNLRFYLHADPILANSLYELLFSRVDRVAFLPDSGRPVLVPADKALLPVGFGADEMVLPYPRHAHPAYRHLQEYFHFPEKFRFVDLALPPLPEATDTVEVLLLLNYMPRERLVVDRDTFVMGCTPIINLFPKLAEPLRLTQRMTEYRLIPDLLRERTTEIHSILRVSGTSESGPDSTSYAPFFSFDHHMEERQQSAYWLARRQHTGRKDLPGTDVHLAFVDLKFNPRLPADQTIFVHTLCTNRTLSEQIPAGAVMQIEEAAPLTRISCLHKPTTPRTPPLGGDTAWRLISHLSLNYLSLSDGPESLRALREILRLYAPHGDAAADQQIQGLREMSTRPVVRRLGVDAWRGFVRGTEVTLEFDERRYVGASAFLFSAVLSRFLGLYTTVNSFTQLVIKSAQRSGIWKTWPPLAGDQRVL